MDDWPARIKTWEAHQAQRPPVTPGQQAAPLQPAGRAASPASRPHRWGQVPTLAAHQRRFRCHICRTPSRGPHTYTAPRFSWIARPDPGDERDHDGVEYVQHTNWEQPTGLARCAKCHAWTCLEHMNKRRCQLCRARLPSG